MHAATCAGDFEPCAMCIDKTNLDERVLAAMGLKLAFFTMMQAYPPSLLKDCGLATRCSRWPTSKLADARYFEPRIQETHQTFTTAVQSPFDLLLRTQRKPMALPLKSDPRWRGLVTGDKKATFTTVPLSMLTSRLNRVCARDPSKVPTAVDELYAFCSEYQAVVGPELNAYFG